MLCKDRKHITGKQLPLGWLDYFSLTPLLNYQLQIFKIVSVFIQAFYPAYNEPINSCFITSLFFFPSLN